MENLRNASFFRRDRRGWRLQFKDKSFRVYIPYT